MMPMDMEMGDDSYGDEQYYDEEMDMDMDPMVASGDTDGGGVYQYGT